MNWRLHSLTRAYFQQLNLYQCYNFHLIDIFRFLTHGQSVYVWESGSACARAKNEFTRMFANKNKLSHFAFSLLIHFGVETENDSFKRNKKSKTKKKKSKHEHPYQGQESLIIYYYKI